MPIGNQTTNKNHIGNFEVRIGPQSVAGMMSPDYSIGIVDSVTLDVQSDMAELYQSFPQQRIAGAITKTVSGFKGTLRENSRRNLALLMGAGYMNYDTANLAVGATVDTAPAPSGAASTGGGPGGLGPILTTPAVPPLINGVTVQVNMDASQTFAVGDYVTIYEVGNPSNTCIAMITANVACTTTTNTNTNPVSSANPQGNTLIHGFTAGARLLTIDRPLIGSVNNAFYNGSTTVQYAFTPGATVRVVKCLVSSLGSPGVVSPYLSARLLKVDATTQRPYMIDFWKIIVKPTLSQASSNSDFGTIDLEVEAYAPTAMDIQSGQPLYHIAQDIASNPIAAVYDIPDSATGK